MILAKASIRLFCQHHYVLLNITLKLIHHLSASVKSASLSCLSLFCLPKILSLHTPKPCDKGSYTAGRHEARRNQTNTITI